MCVCEWKDKNVHPARKVGHYKQGQWGQIPADKLYFMYSSWKYTLEGLREIGRKCAQAKDDRKLQN